MNAEQTNEAVSGALITVANAAKRLSVSPRTVWRLIAKGRLTRRRIRGCTRLLLAEVLGMVEQSS